MHADLDELYRAFNLARQAGDLPQALAQIDQAIAFHPQDARNYFLRSMVLEDMQRLDQAISSLQEAIRIRPDFAEALFNLGILYQDRKQFAEAATCFRKVLQSKPEHARACNNLGTALRSMNDLAGAQRWFERAVLLKPDYALAHFNLGINCMDLGELGSAERSFKLAVQSKPDYVEAYNRLGAVQQLTGKLEQAQASFARAVQLKPGKNGAELHNLAKVYWEQGRTEEAIATYRQAQSLSPYDLKSALGSLLVLPAVYRSQTEVMATRDRFARGLQTLQQDVPAYIEHNAPEKLLDDLRWSNFYLAYQGQDDKALQVGYANFVANLLHAIAPQFMVPLARKVSTGRRLRIGFLSSFFRRCTVGMYFLSWIVRIDRERFETYVYHTRPEHDQVTREIAAASDHFNHLVGKQSLPTNVAAKVRADELDLLVYPELGMDAGSFLLAAMRLAPVQCAGWGHPVTSGHANVDCYFSSAIMEPEDAAKHYAEPLILLEGIGTCYSKPALPAEKSRADFALPDDKNLYLFPQSPFKIHPDNDDLLARVLQRDPDGMIVMFASRYRIITDTLLDRLGQALRRRGVDPKGRIIMLPFVTHDDYLCVNRLCDVMLDTLHWSGGNTSLDAIACGLPIVTLPGQFMRGRQSYGMLRLMGLDQLIARDLDDYVEIALRLGTDKDWSRQVARQILSGHAAIFVSEAPLRQLEQCYVALCNGENPISAKAGDSFNAV